ncbi:unnamed protein product [Orchesella dallaii]|uniref:Death domain-containing protein n=1 Tax=Orchesella dallaii TaxID=48710 RepID=A0ABP1QFX4_9HEXA
MPKRRSISSPVTSPKKSKKPLQTSAPEDNGENDGENDGRLSPQDSGDRVIDSIATSSDEDMEPEPGSEVDISDTDLPKEENGIVDLPMRKHLFGGRTDWTGWLGSKSEFFEKFLLLYDSNSKHDVNSIVDACKDISKRFPEEEPSEKRVLVDQVMREFLLEKLTDKPDTWTSFLDLSIAMARLEICSPTSAIALLTDLVEVSSLDDCSIVFDFIESRLDVWKDPLFLLSGKNAVLRMCNDLLRRQSRAQNTVFCGRILIFLANYFPFSERSGLNILSEFNSDNVTKYKAGDGTDDPDDKIEIAEDQDDKLFEGMDISVPGLDKIVSLTQEEKKKKIKVDYNLYVKFWSLQDYFRTPLDCYNKISWKTFTMYTQDVLGAFHSFKLDEASHRKRKERTEDKLPSINPIPKLGDENLYFAKYLTNRRLLELQMSDPSFRRYFLVQLLVILQYLTLPVKFKTDSQVLSEDQADFIKKTSEKIYELLSETPPQGCEFVKCVKHILRREELWNKWKNDGCQPFKKPITAPATTSSSANATEEETNDKSGKNGSDELSAPTDDLKSKKKKKPRRQIGDSIKDASEKNKILLGHTELTRLWNICPDNLEACRMKSRDFMPQLDAFFSEAFKEMEAEPTSLSVLMDSSKKDFKPKKILGDPMFGWKALRLLARRSPYFFQMFGGAPISPLQNYLEYVLKKINTDRDPPPNSQEDPQMANRKLNETKSKGSDTQANDAENTADNEQVVEAGAGDDDEILRAEENKEVSESGDEEEGEVNDKFVRPLSEEELKKLGRSIGDDWKKLALKLGFKNDEVEYFAEHHKDDAAITMLKNWQDQDDDATVADLIYQLEGIKLKQLVAEVFKC